MHSRDPTTPCGTGKIQGCIPHGLGVGGVGVGRGPADSSVVRRGKRTEANTKLGGRKGGADRQAASFVRSTPRTITLVWAERLAVLIAVLAAIPVLQQYMAALDSTHHCHTQSFGRGLRADGWPLGMSSRALLAARLRRRRTRMQGHRNLGLSAVHQPSGPHRSSGSVSPQSMWAGSLFLGCKEGEGSAPQIKSCLSAGHRHWVRHMCSVAGGPPCSPGGAGPNQRACKVEAGTTPGSACPAGGRGAPAGCLQRQGVRVSENTN
jgi:hypothetical protein